MEKIPAKIKFLLIAMFAVAGIIIAALFFGLSGNRLLATIFFKDNTNSQIKEQTSIEVKKQESAPDSDGDGLNDFEESIYNTDHLNPDTDGDGYLDGEETAAGTDPLSTAPEDIIPSVSEAKALHTNITNRALGSIFYEAGVGNLYAQGENGGKDISLVTLENIVKNTQLNYLYATTIDPIEENEIKIINDNSPEKIKKYVLELADSIKEIFEFSLTPAGNLGRAALLTTPENSQPLKNLFIQYSQETQIISDNLLNTSVPSDLKQFHLETINLALSSKRLFATASQIDSDPLKALLSIAEIPTKIFELNKLINRILDYANEKNIEIPPTQNYLLEIQRLLKVSPPPL